MKVYKDPTPRERYKLEEGWHRSCGYLVYVDGSGLVTKMYPERDGQVSMVYLEKPCRLDAFRARMWRLKMKKKEAMNENKNER